jgi:small GTP-binding protein
LGNEFEESTILTTRLSKNSYNFVDYKSVMKINYYDIPGQEQYMKNNLNVLKKADIILFINDNENLKINFQILEQKVSLEDNECIFCINKSDLIANNQEQIKENYKEINKEKEISDIILTSAMKQKGIEELANKIFEIGKNNNNLKKKDEKQEYYNSVQRMFNGNTILDEVNIKEVDQKKKDCCEDFWAALFCINHEK